MYQPAQPKIVFSDIDGTLLNGSRQLSATTIQTIRKITAAYDVYFILVSARMPMAMQAIYDELCLKTPIICYNGALIMESLAGGFDNQREICSHSIDPRIPLSIFNHTLEHNLHFGLYSNNSWFVSKNDVWTEREENNTCVKAVIAHNMPGIISQLASAGEPIHKLMVMGSPVEIDLLINSISLESRNKITIYRSKETFLEISPAQSSKAKACSLLLDYLNLKPEQAVAFGDNFNDMEMLRIVGTGVAMGNASEEVKRHADKIAPPNTEDGVAFVLAEFFGI